jgi:hypothetical protein
MALFTVLLFLAAVIQAVIFYKQWKEMQSGGTDTHDLAIAAGKQADRTKDLADRMKDQSDRTKDLADQTKSLAESAKTQAGQAIIQAQEATIAARAAKSAADTAKDALHISERAYLSVQNPEIRYDRNSIRLPVVNTGHLPAEGTNYVSYLVVETNEGTIRKHWYHHLGTVASGDHLTGMDQVIKEMDKGALHNGTQHIVIAGRLWYRDGFADTPVAEATYCYQSYVSSITDLVYLGPCSPGEDFPDLERADGDYKPDTPK